MCRVKIRSAYCGADGIITLPIAVLGFLYFPDTPESTRAPYLSPSEVKLAIDRLPPKCPGSHNIDPWSLLKRVFTAPSFYILFFFSAICSSLEAYCVQGLLLLWMKYNSAKFGTDAINSYPLGVSSKAAQVGRLR